MNRLLLAGSMLVMLALGGACERAGDQTPAPQAGVAPLPFLHAAGSRIETESGTPVSLRGFNLGSWLLLEPWMVKLNNQDGIVAEKDVWDRIAARFGDEKMRAAVAAHRENFVTEADIESLHALGVNFVRVPIWWRVLGDTNYDANGWSYLDHLLDWCEARGVYVLIDLHGAPGGQNSSGETLGERPDGNYWGADAAHRAESARWWQTVARRYAGRSVVAGYDLLNEAWGTPSMKALVDHMDELYRAIREVDPRHMIFIEDGLQGYFRLPAPGEMNWTNVVYSFHCYPDNGAAFADRDLVGIRDAQLQYHVPVHIGEFNLYDEARGGISGVDRALDVFNQNGWAWTLWSYKVLEDNHDYFWGLTGYSDGRVPAVSLQESSYDDLLNYFRRTASSNWSRNPLLRACVEQRLNQAEPAAPDPVPGATPLPIRDAVIEAHDKQSGLREEWQWSPPDLGYWGPEDSAAWRVDVTDAGTYRLDVSYASGGDNPNAELWIDGVSAGTTPLSGTGDWQKYRLGSIRCGMLEAGPHVLRLACAGGKDFLNLREAWLVPDKTAAVDAPPGRIDLGPSEISGFRRTGEPCVEWQNVPPNIGQLVVGDAVVFHVNLSRAGQYIPSFEWSSPQHSVQLEVQINGTVADTVTVVGTGDWQKYMWQHGNNPLSLPAGGSDLAIRVAHTDAAEGAGNLRRVRLDPATPGPSAGADNQGGTQHD